MNQTYKKLEKYLDKEKALGVALSLMSWDNETLAPPLAIESTSKYVGILAGEMQQTVVNDDVKNYLEELEKPENMETLTKLEKGVVKEQRKIYDELVKIPANEYQEFQELSSKGISIWSDAKENKNFDEFADILGKLLAYQKKFAGYKKKPEEKLYDVLLKEHESCFGQDQLDLFFDEIKAVIVPLLKKVVESKKVIDKSYNYKFFDKERQYKFAEFLAEYIGFDFDKGIMGESAHPFTLELHNKDVRITNHYYENNLESAIFSVIHEGGHALYEMGIRDDISETILGGGTSLGMHESQSRMYENMIGRSKEFWTPIYSKLQETFPEELSEVSLNQFFLGINKVEPRLIRTEADELCYTLHIIIRYEIEKDLFNDKIKIEDLPSVWNQKYKDYLGVTPENDAEGVLQDMHWSDGSFGYFPSYALGNAIAAQMFDHMRKVMPVDEYLLEGNLTAIREYLDEHVHQYGKLKDTNEILMDMMGETLNPKYYTDYLVEKYTKLYDLK